MTNLEPGRSVETRLPVLKVPAGLKAGKYIFQLVVVNSEGIESEPDRVTVEVLKRRAGPFGGAPRGDEPAPPAPRSRPRRRRGADDA